jgi:hypothetical protein
VGVTEHERAAPCQYFADWHLSALTGIGWFDSDPVIDGLPQSLRAPEVLFCRLDRSVSQQELDPLQFSSGIAAQPCARATQVVEC